MMKTFVSARTSLRRGTALQALALLGAGVGMASLAAPAAAQDYTSGAISGTVTDASGQPIAGAKVTITSVTQGTVRTTTSGSNGSYSVTALSPGAYNVAVDAPGLAGYRAQGVSVIASQGLQINAELGAAGGQEVVVTGQRAVTAFTGTTTGLNVNVADFIKTKPLGRDLTSIILLAPGTATGNSSNSTFNGLTSIGGSSVAENAYYLNGLNLTNFNNYLTPATVPFYFYRSVDVKTGGYPAEYGRATGGITNAVTKAGSNDFFAAVHVDWVPHFLRSIGTDTQIGTRAADGSVTYKNNSQVISNRADSLLVNIEAGGPIIKDRLFVYGLTQLQRVTSFGVNPNAGTASRYRNDDPFWGVKVDAFPIDSQHLEFTIFDTRNTAQNQNLSYNTTTQTVGAAQSITNNYDGGLNFVGKYTGRMTDWLTLSAAYGRVRNRFDFTTVSGDTTTPIFVNQSGTTTYGVPNGGYYNSQRIGSVDSPYDIERKFFRADGDVRFTLLGTHHIRGGYDQEINTLRHVTIDTGASVLAANGLLTSQAQGALIGNAGYNIIARQADTTGACANIAGGCPVVELNYYNTGGAFKGKNQAYYIEDEWKPIDRLTLQIGARRDDFRINKPSGTKLSDLSKNYAPRVGAEYQIFANKTGKIYGSYGWYYLPIASNTAYRQGAPSYYFNQQYYFSGVNSAGLPILTGLRTDDPDHQTVCPLPLVPNQPATNCAVTGNGADINTTQGLAANLKATRESEIIVGYEQKLGLWTLGVSYTHRNLDRTAEDSSIDAAVNKYCAANNIMPIATSAASGYDVGTAVSCSDIFYGFNQYVINNPGSPITVNLLAPGFNIDNRTVTLSAQSLGYGKAIRKYDALTFKFDRAYDGRYSLGGSYTLSRSRGNYEGFVQSDFGQTDAGITQDFDQPGFGDYAYGDLPNDHRHIIKLYGEVALNDQFNIGLNTQVQSPTPLSCYGYHPTDAFARVYGAASHFCGGQPSPRGTALRTDWYESINLQLRYTVKIRDAQFALRADVFNLLNSQAVTLRNETGDLARQVNRTTGAVTYISNPSYGLPTSYQAPRYMRLGLDINF